MPGIVGLVTRMPRQQAERQLQRMLETLLHEKFYCSGTWKDESLGVYVGWVARKNSFSADMPIRNERGDITLIFSGEEFAPPDTVGELRAKGHAIDSDDCSYLVHLYEERHDFFRALNGRFHGLVIDQSKSSATLFNDRYSMHRLYTHESLDAVYFAAEAKAILAVRPELRTADYRSIGEFLTCGCVLENRTFFEDICVLPGASRWTFQSGTVIDKGIYFSPSEWEAEPLLESEQFYQEVRDVFSRNLPRYFKSREPIGLSVTGGLDTRMIVAWHKAVPGTLPMYTFGGMFRECQDVSVGRRVAEACRQPHTILPVAEDFLARFAYYAERTVYLTDGCADVIRSPDLYVNEQVREIAPVRMNGVYGGEVLRRVRAFKPVDLIPGMFTPSLDPHIRQAKETYKHLIEGHALTFGVFKQAPWYLYGTLCLEQSQVSMRSPFLDNDFVRVVFKAPASAVQSTEVSLRLIADGDRELSKIPTDRGLIGPQEDMGTKARRGLLEFLFKAEYAYDYGMPQWLARLDHMVQPLRLEHLFLGRHKFYHFRLWYREYLAQYLQDILLDRRTLSRPYLQRKNVESMLAGHLKGNRNYTMEIHKVLTLELLHRLFLDPK